jgi:hypothetical protein
MSLLTMEGQFINAYKANDYINKETGETTVGANKVQIMGQVPVASGEGKAELITLSCHDIAAFKLYSGKRIKFAVGVMASGKDIIYFIPKGTKPEQVNEKA